MLNETFPVIFKHLASMIENETVLDKHPILVDCVEILCSLWKTIDFWMSQNIFKFPDIGAADLLKLLMIGTKGPQLLLTVYDYDCGMNNERTALSPPQRRGALTATQTFCRVFCCPVRVGAAALRLHAPMHVVNDRDNNNFPISTIKWKWNRHFYFVIWKKVKLIFVNLKW